RTWNTLADNACSHHIMSLAPAVALPAPRHDRRRTGAAGSPPGGFPFVEPRRAVVKYRHSSRVPDAVRRAAVHRRSRTTADRDGSTQVRFTRLGAHLSADLG